MVTQVNTERLQLIQKSLELTAKPSPAFLRDLESSSKYKPKPQINEGGYSPYIYSVAISPSNRIQIKVHPYFENRGKSSKQDDAAISAFERENNSPESIANRLKAASDNRPIAARVLALGEGADAPPGAADSDPLASLSNCHALKNFPFSPELEFQEWAEDNLQLPFDSGNFSAVPALPRAKQFTRLARRTILDAAGALEKEGYLPSEFQFFTGTLPGSTSVACEYFARYSRKFLNAMKTALGRLGLNLTFNCWEWQMRKKANLVPALHLHMVIVCQDVELAARLPQYLEDMWFRLLIHYSAQSGVDFFEKHDRLGGGRWTREQLKKLSERDKNPLETCKTVQCSKSVGAYLSKYVGKGSLSGDKDFQDKFKKHSVPLYYPSSWWSISNSIRELIKKHSSAVSFISNMNKCMEAYHSLTSILQDEEYDLVELALPVFIPEWSNGNRFYQNFYCKSDSFQVCSELISTYSDNYVFPDGQPGNYQSNRSLYIPQTSTSIRLKIQSDESGRLLSSLVRSLPFYCVREGQVDWDNPIVVEVAFNVINAEIDYPALESLEDRISWQNHLDSLSDDEKSQRADLRVNPYLFETGN